MSNIRWPIMLGSLSVVALLSTMVVLSPMAQAQGGPMATRVYVDATYADMAKYVVVGGGQMVSFSGKILIHFEDSNELILAITEKGSEAGLVLVYLAAPIAPGADETTQLAINGIVGGKSMDVFLAGSAPNKLTLLTIQQAYITSGIAQVLPTVTPSATSTPTETPTATETATASPTLTTTPTLTTPEQRTATAQARFDAFTSTAQALQSAATGTKQARLDTQTSVAADYQATQTAYYNNVTGTADARHATQTQQVSDYHDTATAYAANYVPPTQLYVAPVSSGGSSGGGNVAPTSVPVAAGPSHPAGATGQCKDGTYTYTTNHTGACSHHGGVAQWF